MNMLLTTSEKTAAMLEQPLVIIVDDDDGVRMALKELMESVGLEAACFSSAQELAKVRLCERPGCIVLDVRLPGISGLDFHCQLASTGIDKPVVFLTGHGDISMSVQAMKAGAIDFLTKPVRDQTLLDAVMIGIARDVENRSVAQVTKIYVDRFNSLTPRERQVFRGVANGQANKQIAYDLGISEITVKLHRTNTMRKMRVTSIGDAVRAWEAIPQTTRDRGVN
ncbi:response regulator transcription factor [Ferrovibrio sp.]|uniref:response regulator transcription factor n=1 Tax=Ferrovibrio sp. TaxID=1917215 RepID=UPI0025C72BC9|nr:response regulator transcription factor [Ferrovibrio sp.]